MGFSPLNAELNPTCHLLALLGAHHILHVSSIRVNSAFKGLVAVYTEFVVLIFGDARHVVSYLFHGLGLSHFLFLNRQYINLE